MAGKSRLKSMVKKNSDKHWIPYLVFGTGNSWTAETHSGSALIPVVVT